MSNLRSTHIAAMAMATIALMLLSGLSGNSAGNAAEDSADATLTHTVTVSVISPPPREVEYKLYDFLAEPFGDWWGPRWLTYGTDVIVSEGPNANAYLYYVNGHGGSDPNTQGEIYAPYRYNVTARNLTSINVHHPEFMPTPSTPVSGAHADLSVYMQYIYQSWWTVLRADWVASGYNGSIPGPNFALTTQDGYMVTTLYDIRMNREAALEWIGLPTSEADPVSWYAVIGDDHADALNDWFLNEGNVRLDIAYAYEDNYYDLYTATRLSYDAGTDEVTLEVMHFSWGGEVLMTRWLTEGGVSPNHEPWYEDFSMNVSYSETYTNLSLDGVCQYSMHAIEATGTTGGAAWVWEPSHIDYVVEEELPSFVDPNLPSEYEPYYTLTYTSHNAGDNLFGEEVGYEYTPYWFNLTEGEKLVIEMPSESILGYEGVGLDYTDYADAEGGDVSAFEAIEAPGTVTLGDYVTGGPVLTPVGQTITVEGPVSFDNTRHTAGGPLYHGAPWIEFDVGSPTTTASLEGSVLDSEDLTPVPYATVILYYERPDGSYYYNIASCDYNGYYTVTVPSQVVSICAYGMNHAPLYTTLDLTAGGSIQADLLLELDLSAPTCAVTSSLDGYVSTVRSTTVTGVASDEYIRLMYMEVLRKSESASTEVEYVAFDHKYVFLEPPLDVANVPYSVGDGTASIDLEWGGTTSDGGWLTHSAGSVYLPTEISADMCEMRGFYTDTEFTDAKVFLLFSESTGELLRAFFYDPYLGEVDPSSLIGTFEPAVLTYAFDEASGSPMPTYDMWTPTGVICQMPELTFTLDPVLPSGDYRMLMRAYDYGYNSGAAFVDVLVDNDVPTADAGPDQVVSEGDVVILSAAGSYDNVGIESCAWTIFAEDMIILYGSVVSYKFEEPGTYEVLLTVVDVAGNVATDTVVVTVTPGTVEIEVRKLEGNPSRSTMTWDLSPNSDAVLDIAVKNHGLRRLTVELFVYDASAGEYVLLWRDSVALGDPGTIVYFEPSPVLLAGGMYRVMFTPLGDAGTWAVVYADLVPPPASYVASLSEQVTISATCAVEAVKSN